MYPLYVITIYISESGSIDTFKKQLTILLRTANSKLSIALATNSDEIYEFGRKLFKSLNRIWLPESLDECSGHGIEGKRFRFAFAKISTLRIFLQLTNPGGFELNQYSHLVLIDSDSFFPGHKIIKLKKNFFYGVNYLEEHRSGLSVLTSLLTNKSNLNESFLNKHWINTGYLAIPIDAIKLLSVNCQDYLNKCKSCRSKILAKVNHYSDEIVFNFAIADLLLENTYNYDFTPVSSPKKYKPAFLWTVHMQSRRISLINYFNPPCHVHAPDIKYSDKKIKIYASLSKLALISKPIARITIISAFNTQVLWNKLIRPFLSGLKRFQFKRYF